MQGLDRSPPLPAQELQEDNW
uniref:Uncharacterized protein n=1 Tax=Arundo donax TaxID=35708 RepID=A0A0A9AHB4_ARUDO